MEYEFGYYWAKLKCSNSWEICHIDFDGNLRFFEYGNTGTVQEFLDKGAKISKKIEMPND